MPRSSATPLAALHVPTALIGAVLGLLLAGGCQGTRSDSDVRAPRSPTTSAQSAFAMSEECGEPLPGGAATESESFDDYVAFGPRGVVSSDGSRSDSRVELLLVGEASDPERRALAVAARFAEHFLAVEVRWGAPAELPTGAVAVADGVTRRPTHLPHDVPGHEVATTWFLDTLLPSRATESAVGVAALTTAPLFVRDTGRRTFGEADRVTGAAVCSLDRLYDPWTGRGEVEDEESRRRTELRAMKLVTHELAHVFGLLHCDRYRCVVNAVATATDLDARPLALCPDCLRKLQWNRGFDVLARYADIERFLLDLGHTAEARWFGERLRHVQRSGEMPPR